MKFKNRLLTKLPIFLIPIVIITYILVMNYFGIVNSYTLDVGMDGDTDTSQMIYMDDSLVGNVISENKLDDYGIAYREILTGEPFYVYVKYPLQPVDIRWVDTEITFQGNLELDMGLRRVELAEISESEINATFRGDVDLIVYLKDTLRMAVSKQDLNWYMGRDEYLVELYDVEDNLIFTDKLLDDGIINDSKDQISPQIKEVSIDNLEEGLYLLKFINIAGENRFFDSTISRIRINTGNIVTDGRIHILNPSTLFFNLNKNTILQFKVWHKEALHPVTIMGTVNKTINLDETLLNKEVLIELPPGEYILSMEGDLYLSGTNFAFSSDQYFQPYRYTPFVSVGSEKFVVNDGWSVIKESFHNSEIESYENDYIFRLQKIGEKPALLSSIKITLRK